MRFSHNFLKPLDFVAMTVFVAIICFFCVISWQKSDGLKVLVIESSGSKWIYDLDNNIEIEIPGTIGFSTIHIGEGCACFEDSPCANKTCVTSGKISKPGEWASCLPNGVFIRIENNSTEIFSAENDVDIIAK